MSTLNRSCRTLLLPLLIACLAVLAGCGAAGSAGDAENTPRSVTHVLSPGEQVAITATDTLKLERVNDSRCRKGAVCVWKGYVSYRFSLLNSAGATDLGRQQLCPAVYVDRSWGIQMSGVSPTTTD